MATVKISNLPPATNPVASTSLVPVVQGGVTKRATLSQIGTTLNVQAFGAVGDGVTDDMDAFKAAADYLRTNGGTALYIPATPNGYYLRRGTGCDLSGANNVAIISDGATLKLQGGTLAQTGAVSVFYAATTGITNLYISGLRFVSASQVTRYQNGGASGAAAFDPEVVAGRADANETTSFRYALAFTGPSSNITIENCYFGPGIYEGIDVKSAGTPVTITNVKLNNLTFDGINSQCVLYSYCKGVTFSNIVSLNKRGCRFDWTFYTNIECENISFSNIIIKHASYSALFGSSAFSVDFSPKNVVISNLYIENVGASAFSYGSGGSPAIMERLAMSSVVIKSCGSSTGPVFNANGLTRDVVINGLIVEDCPWIIEGANATRFNVDNFIFKNASQVALRVGAGFTGDITLSNGKMVDCGAKVSSNESTIRVQNDASAVRSITVSNVDFIFDTYVPDYEVVDVRGAASTCELVNCRFISNSGTSAKTPIYSGDSASIFLTNCSTSGYSATMTYSGAVTGLGVSPRIGQLPMLEATLAANSATPSVLNRILCVTANTLATAITNFTDGVQGQDIAVRVNDANTTFDFSSSSLKGNNGVDFAAASGDMVFCKKVGANWYCTIVEA